jgi:hypothetical protein
MASRGTETPVVSLNSTAASSYYLDYMGRGCSHKTLSAQDARRAKLLVKWFDAAATSAERELLMPAALRGGETKDQGERRRVVDELHRVVKARLASAFSEAGVVVPRDLGNDKQLTVGSIESRLSELRKSSGGKAKLPDVDEKSFSSFRVSEAKRKAAGSARNLSSGDLSGKRAAV